VFTRAPRAKETAGKPEAPEGEGGTDEVGNPMGVGAGRESGSQVRPDRNPEVRRGRAPDGLRAMRKAGAASTRGEGESPTAEQEDPGGEEGQESIGPIARVTTSGRERTLGRSKALRSTARKGRNGERAEDAERRHGWPNGKSSEDRNPRGGCGAKQSHEARAG